MESIDNSVMETIDFFISQIFSGITIMFVIAYVVPSFLVGVITISLAYYFVAKPYLVVS
jgi:hypothetical protein